MALNRTIEPQRLNIRVMTESKIYWAGAHKVALVMARIQPHQKQQNLAVAAYCRQQYEELVYHLRIAKHYRNQYILRMNNGNEIN